MTNAAHTFTASQIALALGRKRQAIARALECVPPSDKRFVAGNETHTWSFSALPARLQTELSEHAARRGYRNADAMLASNTHPLAEEFVARLRECPIETIRAEFISRALQLRDALAAPLAQQHTLSNQELTELGLKEFARVFSYSLSPKHWNRIFDRTVARDNGAEQFLRVELYLDGAAFQKPIAKVAIVAKRFDHAALADAVAQLENQEKPTVEDRAFLFHCAFEHLAASAPASAKKSHQRAAKASVIAFLHSAVPGLSKSLAGLRRTFELKLQTWNANGRAVAALRDNRQLTSGNFRAPLCDGCKQTLISIAVAHDGNESLAYRLARTRGLLCAPCTEGHSFNVRVDKSAVPAVVREQITPLIESVLPLHRGPREAKMRGPYIMRNWDDVLPGDWFRADDITWNHYFKTEDGSGNVTITRGECLLMIDLRTGYPLEFSIIAGKYNSEHIRGLMLRTHDIAGLPHNGYYYEKGVWASRLIDGTRREGMPAHWRETELGLKQSGLSLDVRHATTPRAKTIEGLIHILQDRMRSIPGFVGFNERLDRRERVQATLSRARRGDEASLEKLPTLNEWRSTVRAVLDEYAHDPQNGKMLKGEAAFGASPAEMWNEAITRRPLRRLAVEARHILATHCQPTRVRQEGIVLTVRGQKFLYANEQTGALIGRDVFTYYNVECPELLTVSDMKRQNFFSVKRIELPAMSATGEQFAEVNAQIRGHRAAAKTLYGEIKHDLVSTITRDADHDAATKELGRFHNAEVEQHTQQKTERTRKLSKIQKASAALGAPVRANIRNPDRVLQGIELEQQMRARLAERETESGSDGNEGPSLVVTAAKKKVYVLNTPPALALSVEQLRRAYWSLAKKVEALGVSRHALTQKTFGGHPKVNSMTADQLSKIVSVFSAVIREAKEQQP